MKFSVDAKAATRLNLLSVALFFFFGSMHLLNIFISLTVEGSGGVYLEFVNAHVDRIIVYTLNATVMIYLSARLGRACARRLLLFLLLSSVVFAGYFMFSPVADVLLIVGSFMVLTWFLTGVEPFAGVSRRKALSDLVIYFVAIPLSVELLSLVCWLVIPVSPPLSQDSICRRLVDIETKTFLLTGGFAPLLAVLFLFSWIAKPLSRINLSRRFRALFSQVNVDSFSVPLAKPFVSNLLLLSIVFSFVVALYPYLPGLNTDFHPIGVDTVHYEQFLLDMENGSMSDVIVGTFFRHSIRPLSLYVMYLVKYVGGLSALSVAEFFPLLLAPAVVLAVFFFVREVFGKSDLASLAAFFAFSSFHVSVGLYGGLLSNWMAIVLSYLFMGFFFSFLKSQSLWKGFFVLLLSVATLFTHAASWGMVMGVLLVYLCYAVLKHRRAGCKSEQYFSEIRLLIVVIAANVFAVLLRNYALGLPVWEIETWRTAEEAVSAGAPLLFLEDICYTFFNTMYSFFVNTPILLLAALGGSLLVLGDKPVNRYLTSWLFASSVFFVFAAGWRIRSRILFNIPLPIFEVVGLIVVCSVIQRFFAPERVHMAKALVTFLVMLVSLNYAFRCAFALSQIVF